MNTFPCDRCSNTGRVMVRLDSALERAGGAYRDICPVCHGEAVVADRRRRERRATLASLLPEGEVLDAAIEAGIKAAGNYLCDGAVREGVRAAAPILLADKAREIEATRNDYGACYAAMCKAQDAHRVAEARVAALEGALKDLIARVDAVGNWGPLSPVTDTHRTLLDGGTR